MHDQPRSAALMNAQRMDAIARAIYHEMREKIIAKPHSALSHKVTVSRRSDVEDMAP